MFAVLLVGSGCAGAGSGTTASTISSAAVGQPSAVEDRYAETLDVLAGKQSPSQRTRYDAILNSTITDCMKVAGFDYWALTPQAQEGAGSGPFSRDPSFLKKYGYAIATAAEQNAAILALGEYERDHDRNSLYVSGLSEMATESYLETLYGPGRGASGDDGQVQSSSPGGGCVQMGQDAVDKALGIRPGLSNTPALFDALSELGAAVQTDGRYQTALADWKACMAAAGLTVESPLAAISLVSGRVSAVFTSETKQVTMQASDGSSVQLRVPLYGSSLAEVAQYELFVATSDADCDQVTGLTAIETEVRTERQIDFVEKFLVP